MRLPALPKVGDWPVAEHRPAYHGEMLASQWSIPVPQAPTVEFTASTPPLEDSQLFASQSETSQFQDADEDYRPLVGSWADIVEREEQARLLPLLCLLRLRHFRHRSPQLILLLAIFLRHRPQ